MSRRYLADLAERALRTFIQAYLAAVGITADGVPGGHELVTWEAAKYALVAALLSVAMSFAAKPAGDPDSASVLAPGGPPAPPDTPGSRTLDPTLLSAGQWTAMASTANAAGPAAVTWATRPRPERRGLTDAQVETLRHLVESIQPVAAPPPPPDTPARLAARAPTAGLVGGRGPGPDGANT